MATQLEVKPLIIAEWLRWAEDDRSQKRLLSFHAHVKKNQPSLLSFRCAGDPWQVFKSMLKDHITD